LLALVGTEGINKMKISVALAALLSATGIVADSDEGLPKLRIGTYSIGDLPLGRGWPLFPAMAKLKGFFRL
jgi:hypothetical protein